MPTGVRDEQPSSPISVTAVALLGVAVIGLVDYATGIDVRVFPLYFVPISVAAWWAGRMSTMLVAVASTVAWLTSNLLAGQHLPMWIDVVNSLMQLGSFALVGALISVLRSAHARELDRSRTDPLTGLLNSRGFIEDAHRIVALSRRHGAPMTLAYVDLDAFKQVNDSHGHAKGDEILQLAARVMRTELREGDLAARMGGDEFALLLPHTDEHGAHRVLGRLHELLQARLRTASPVTGASMGAAAFARPPASLDLVIQRADQVMYGIKASGRGRVVVEAFGEVSAEAS